MTDPTAAALQAELLRAIADHLDQHPDLPPLNISAHTAILGCQISGTDRPAGLIAWARSLHVPAIQLAEVNPASILPSVRGYFTAAFPYDTSVEVWSVIDELTGTDRTVITVDELEQLLDDQAAATPESPATSPDTATATAPRKDPA